MTPPLPGLPALSSEAPSGLPQRVLSLPQTLPLLDTAGVRQLEAQAMRTVPAHTLMHRAGAAVTQLALALAPHARQVWIAAGPGNNGGDGLEAAWRLHRAGKQVLLTLLGDPARLPADAAQAWTRAQEAGVVVQAQAPSGLGRDDLIIDALLGIGGSRPPEGVLAQTIMAINGLGRSAARPAGPRILAIDLPSGLQADTGVALDAQACVHATDTLTVLALKPGLFTGVGRDVAGELWFSDLGCSGAQVQAACAELVGADIQQALAPRRHTQHKGSFGSVWVVGGAAGMQGAATLAAAAALRCGAGRVYLAALADAAALPPLWPELMPRALDLDAVAQPEVVTVCGCGGGTAVAEVLPELLRRAPRLLIDADGLNAVGSDPGLQTLLSARAAHGFSTVLTPHPLEAARLLGCGAAEVQADRLRAAQALSARYACVALLKGSGSVIAAPGAPPAINRSGNAALATAGSGDVLAGLIGGLWAQGVPARDAALLAAYRHGRVADLSGRDRLVAADLLGA